MKVAPSTRQQLWRRLLDQPCCLSAFAAKPASTRKGYLLRGIGPSAEGDSALQGPRSRRSCSPRRLPATWPRPRCALRGAALGATLSTSTRCISQVTRCHCCREAQSLTAGNSSRCCYKQLALSFGAGVDSRPRRGDNQAHSLSARVDLRPWRRSHLRSLRARILEVLPGSTCDPGAWRQASYILELWSGASDVLGFLVCLGYLGIFILSGLGPIRPYRDFNIAYLLRALSARACRGQLVTPGPPAAHPPRGQADHERAVSTRPPCASAPTWSRASPSH